MPLSAHSPEGPISLVGMDLRTIENLKARNRVEKIFTAKCCGAPVQIRTPADRVAHFYHTTSNPSCDGGGRESSEHLQLKYEIASAAMRAGWTVDVEAEKRSADGFLEWKADVLAQKGKIKVAFEVQISNQDWTTMHDRQIRYSASGVRGLWFVRTRKPLPLSKDLPIFRVSNTVDNYQVHLAQHDDWRGMWWERADSIDLTQFVLGALNKQLNWAPFLDVTKEPRCTVGVYAPNSGVCLNCGRLLVSPYGMSMDIETAGYYPAFVWHQGMRNTKRTFWKPLIFSLVQSRWAGDLPIAMYDDVTVSCGFCRASARQLGQTTETDSITATILLSELPAPRPGTIEWDWLNRWAFKP